MQLLTPSWLTAARALQVKPGQYLKAQILDEIFQPFKLRVIYAPPALSAAFLNHFLNQSGQTGNKSLSPLDFANYGRKLHSPHVGAIAVIQFYQSGHLLGGVAGLVDTIEDASHIHLLLPHLHADFHVSLPLNRLPFAIVSDYRWPPNAKMPP